ncbi:allene oxide synthase 3-like [Senna tora]|uniref:Allene oxide synthase 3-like n=1 Tax=Senna tora TaxID=362788 RepID=A0A835CI74_9FABA|nr:allene oxide synthase 3-like [Senna tora]
MSSSTSRRSSSDPNSDSDSKLPLRPIPGGYGLPFFGAIADRFDFFYNQGREKFFKSRIQKHKSTVFRTNMPPGPFTASDPKVVAVLDAVSFAVLFDNSKVEKRDVFTGTYMPSTDFTGGYRICAYLDPSEQKHRQIKSFLFWMLSSRHGQVIPLLRSYLSELFLKLEDQVADKGEANYNSISDNELFNFAFRFYCGKDPTETNLGSSGAKLFELWTYPQLAPLGSAGLPWYFFPINVVEDFLLRTVPFPAWLLKFAHKKLYHAIYSSALEPLDEAARFGLTREEACNNILFVLGFNSYGGFKIIAPTLLKWVGLAGAPLHQRLAQEIRAAVKSEGGVTPNALSKMPLAKSVVWETLRIEPPVPFQYGKAKSDIVVESHDAAFKVKKGEMLFGFQPVVTKDSRVFEKAEEFVGDRFVGEEGEKLLKYVYWSNGRETEDPTVENKQCPGKDLVVLVLRVLLVELFLRYDTFEIELGTPTLGPSVKVKKLTKATTTS